MSGLEAMAESVRLYVDVGRLRHGDANLTLDLIDFITEDLGHPQLLSRLPDDVNFWIL